MKRFAEISKYLLNEKASQIEAKVLSQISKVQTVQFRNKKYMEMQ